MKIKDALEKITDNLAQLLKNNLEPQDDLLVLEAQELALDALHDTSNRFNIFSERSFTTKSGKTIVVPPINRAPRPPETAK